ncbi:MAG: hypothetical protein ACYTGG_01430 [Planctomycetota bacterium]|jgi:hypothetical protein
MIGLWPHYFDRELSLTREEKRQVNKRAWKIWFQRRSNVAVYVAVLVPLNVLLNVVPWILRELTGRNEHWHWPLALAVYMVLLIVAVAFLQRYRFGPSVRRAVRELGYDICLRCGYWLKGLDESIEMCPECGARRASKAA